MLNPQDKCHCKSGVAFAECCSRFLNEQAKPETAESLMRSRYSAFATKNWDYLVKTTHPNYRSASLKAELEKNEGAPQWYDLEILKTTAGGRSDKQGKVKFRAHYFQNGRPCELEEHSRFKRYKGDWMYLDGDHS